MKIYAALLLATPLIAYPFTGTGLGLFAETLAFMIDIHRV